MADMRNIVKRGEYSFRARVYCNGSYQTATFDTLKDAQIWRDRIKANQELDVDKREIKKSRMTQREAKSFTLKQALERYALEVTPSKKGAAVELTRINKAKQTALWHPKVFTCSRLMTHYHSWMKSAAVKTTSASMHP